MAPSPGEGASGDDASPTNLTFVGPSCSDAELVGFAYAFEQTGAYRLVASTAAPWPVKTVQSGKFNVSPSC